MWAAGTKDSTAPWMNTNSIVSMLAEAASPPAHPVAPVQVALKHPKASHFKQKKQHKVSKKRSKDKRAERKSRRQVQFVLFCE